MGVQKNSTKKSEGSKRNRIPAPPKVQKKYAKANAPAPVEEKPFKKAPRPKKVYKKREKEDEEIEEVQPILSDNVRLNKFLAHAGVASRRKADELIASGKVTVNSAVVREMGHRVNWKVDVVEFEGKKIVPESKVYILINKPKDYITTTSDEKDRRTVLDLVKTAYKQIKSPTKPRIYPVGRLDRNTTGVLLLTNDGELAQKLTHPSSEIRKVYHVILDKKLMKEDFDKIADGGVVLSDGIAEIDEIAFPNPKNRAEVGLEIHTGKNRFVRRLFEAIGYEVIKLDRVYFGGLTKKDLARGKWRFLTDEEVRNLKYFKV